MRRVVGLFATAMSVLVAGTAGAQVSYSDGVVSFALLGNWVRERNPDPTVWVSFLTSAKDAHFIVSVVDVKKPFADSASRLAAIESLASVRRKGVQALSNGTAQFTKPVTRTVGDQFEYEFSGEASRPPVSMRFRFVSRNNKVATFSVYDYGRREPSAFQQLAEQCLSQARILQ